MLSYFNESIKRHLKFNELVEIMEIQNNKLLKHVKRCILGIRSQLKTRTQSFFKNHQRIIKS
jgi:hypothetical protein